MATIGLDMLHYAKITEEWVSETKAVVTNQSDFAADYAVLCFEQDEPHALCGFRRVHLEAGETVSVQFEKYE